MQTNEKQQFATCGVNVTDSGISFSYSDGLSSMNSVQEIIGYRLSRDMQFFSSEHSNSFVTNCMHNYPNGKFIF